MDFPKIKNYLSSLDSASEARETFAEMCRFFLLESPAWRGRFEHIWLWTELDRESNEGIDLVAHAVNGDYWAIQARACSVEPEMNELNSFLESSIAMRFKQKMLMSGVGDIGKPARKILHSSSQRVELVLRREFSNACLDWSRWIDRDLWPRYETRSIPKTLLWLLNTLSIGKILIWADEHHGRTGKWPGENSGSIGLAPDETWQKVASALSNGARGLSKGLSLAKLLAKYRGAKNPQALPALTEGQILAWADEHRKRTGEWPKKKSGPVFESPGEDWRWLDEALRESLRGLPGGSSLAKLLYQHRGVMNQRVLPRLSEELLISWADKHHKRTGFWPTAASGLVSEGNGETWASINAALRNGLRGLPGGTSLSELLRRHRGVRNIANLPLLNEKQILLWADKHHKKTGTWPRISSGAVRSARGEEWRSLNVALDKGHRGLPGGSSLAKLLEKHRGVKHRIDFSKLNKRQILSWADDYWKKTGHWPNESSGPVAGTTWSAVNSALVQGTRGLAGGSSLARLLAEQRGVRNLHNLPHLTKEQILAWADEHHKRTGRWPSKLSGKVEGAENEKWSRIDAALKGGFRGLPGGSSLPLFLAKERAVRNIHTCPLLSEDLILSWAYKHYRRTGCWPNTTSGQVDQVPYEKWLNLDFALKNGHRGLSGGSSLAKLLAKYRTSTFEKLRNNRRMAGS